MMHDVLRNKDCYDLKIDLTVLDAMMRVARAMAETSDTEIRVGKMYRCTRRRVGQSIASAWDGFGPEDPTVKIETVDKAMVVVHARQFRR